MKWIDVEEQLPEPMKPVLATYKKEGGDRETIVGLYVPAKHTECRCLDECFCNYDEDDDAYYIPEGWYEQQCNWENYSSISVHEGEVDLWMPLPNVPA